MIRYFPRGEVGVKKSKRFSTGSDFTDQISTGELSGVDSAGIQRQGY